MDEAAPEYEIVLRTKWRDECLESRLVLAAMAISAEAVQQDGGWVLVVKPGDVAAAAAELEAYRRENPERSAAHPAVPVYGDAATAVYVYLGILILVASFTVQRTFGLDWFSAGQMQAGQVMAGEWWRTVTALTLHLDAEHLIANLLFGALFGFLAGRVLGGGVAGLAIVMAGALGNGMNAAVQPASHSSIGASTAVFAALGLVVSHALRPWVSVQQKLLQRWSPLVGGVVLLAMTGFGGEHTDIVAHVTGFLAGLLIGWLGCRLPHAWLVNRRIQKAAGFLAVAIVASAWFAGWVAAD